MATQVQFRRGTTSEHGSFTGAVGEITVDTDKDTAVVHDGTAAGGRPLLREDLSNLANGSVTYAKIQDVSATDRLLGRSSAGAGDVEEITCTAAGRALLDDANAAAQRTTLGLGTLATASSIATADIAADAVTYAKIQNVSATDRLLGRSSAGAGDVEEITCTAAGRALLDDADAAAQRTTLGLGALATSSNVGTGLTDPVITGCILEDIHTITDGAAFEVDPGNGSVQLVTLGANRTPKATNFAAGESVTLMVDDGSAFTLTWSDSTWGTGGVTWVGGSAPTLATTGYTVLQFWKVGTKVYGFRVGDVA